MAMKKLFILYICWIIALIPQTVLCEKEPIDIEESKPLDLKKINSSSNLVINVFLYFIDVREQWLIND